jgi:RHS repeat-associated protein
MRGNVAYRRGGAGYYRFAFNGQEKDDEIHGAAGTSYDFGARLYDPRVGRWLSLDPLAQKFPDQSPYNFANDNPIYYVDPNGKTGITYLTVIDKQGHETKITLVDHDAVKSYDHYSHFWDDGTTWTSKWDYTETATLDFRNNPKGTFTVTSDPNLIRRVDWRASLARLIQNPAAGGGMVMSSASGEGGAPPGFGDGRILNVDGLVGMLGGASTTSKSKLKSVEDFVALIGQWAETYNRTDAALEKMGLKIEVGGNAQGDKSELTEPDPNDTICCGNDVLHLRKDSATHSNPITPPAGKTADDYKGDKK